MGSLYFSHPTHEKTQENQTTINRTGKQKHNFFGGVPTGFKQKNKREAINKPQFESIFNFGLPLKKVGALFKIKKKSGAGYEQNPKKTFLRVTTHTGL